MPMISKHDFTDPNMKVGLIPNSAEDMSFHIILFPPGLCVTKGMNFSSSLVGDLVHCN